MEYVVLDDLSTYSGVPGAVVAVLTEAGEREVAAAGDFKVIELDDKEYVEFFVTISDLRECWDKSR